MKTFAFIDASNLFYGGEKSLGWKIDYEKLLWYLKGPRTAREIRQFAGSNFRDFEYLKYILKMEEREEK
jgi:uncharacterized LabA/DUF88 family protein